MFLVTSVVPVELITLPSLSRVPDQVINCIRNPLTFSMKDPIVHILGFPLFSVVTAHLCLCSVKAAIALHK